MAATADPEVPVDLLGNPLSLEDIKHMIRHDVAVLAELYRLKAADDAKRDGFGLHIPNRRLLNEVEMWEKAHDLHWAWYRAGLNATT